MSEQPTVGLVGDGPALEAVRAALSDRDGESEPLVEAIEPSAAADADLVVVAAQTGDASFAETNRRRAGPWLAVALGGIGGLAVAGVEASVAGLGGDGPCYDCLVTRVRSALDELPTGSPTVDPAAARLAGAKAGRLALDALDGRDPVGTVVELPHAERRLLPVPNCGCDDGSSGALDRTFEPLALEATLERAEGAVDARLGPIVSIGEAESFPAPYYLAGLCDTRGFSDATASRQAAGVAADWNPAFVKAVGEALERYSAGVYRESAFHVAPVAALDDVVPPDRFVRPADAETPAPEEPLAWVPGEDLRTGDSVHLPAERVVFPPPTERLGPAITTGLGLGSSGVGALVSGLTEVVERDATMLAWYSTFAPLGLEVDDAGFDALVRRARSADLAVSPMLVTQDVDVAVVTVALHRDGDWPRFAVGSGAALDPVRAARGALEEALQNWLELRGMGRETAEAEEPRVARYATFPPEAQTLLDGVEGRVAAADVGPVDPPTGEAALAALLDRVAAADLDAYAVRLTPRDVASLGFEAVRVLVPAAQPLFTGERFFGERARTVPRQLGFRPRLDRPPHPYP